MGVPFGTDDTALEGQLLETARSASLKKVGLERVTFMVMRRTRKRNEGAWYRSEAVADRLGHSLDVASVNTGVPGEHKKGAVEKLEAALII